MNLPDYTPGYLSSNHMGNKISSGTLTQKWKQILNHNKGENVLLKTELSVILRDKFHPNLLESAEGFQTRFIAEDQLIELLRKKVDHFNKILEGTSANGKPLGKAGKILGNLEKEINESASRFEILKTEFDDFRKRTLEDS